MLSGQLSNQDEDAVEDELAELQRQAEGPVKLPEVPTAPLPKEDQKYHEQQAKERARARAREQSAVPAS